MNKNLNKAIIAPNASVRAGLQMLCANSKSILLPVQRMPSHFTFALKNKIFSYMDRINDAIKFGHVPNVNALT